MIQNYNSEWREKYPKQKGTVAHVCNSSYSRGRDPENHDSRPAWTKSLRPYLKT
jgi:hypothetical protein